MRTICTIGYEGADVDTFVYTLGAAGVDCVIDIREVSASRRPGFSKSALQSHLALAGIKYVHLRSLGDPKHGREAMRRGDEAMFRRIYDERLNSPEAQIQLTQALELAAEHSISLLCYERDPKHCHRSIVAAAMKEQRPFTIRHLGVQSSRRIVDAKATRGEHLPIC